MTEEVFTTIHYPACNDRCDGDSHWLEDDPEGPAQKPDWDADGWDMDGWL